MIHIYKTDNKILRILDQYEEGAWLQLTNPSLEESQQIADQFNIDILDLRTALDDEESSRVSIEDGYTLILVDIPSREIRNERDVYTTIPLGVLLTENAIITVCAEENAVLNHFTQHMLKDFSTKKKMRFLYQILYRCCMYYQSYLRIIDHKRTEIEENINRDTEDSDLIDLHELESTLVYFATSLRKNGVVLNRLTRYEKIKQYPEDKELLEDVIVENTQAIEMTQIYRDIISGTKELLSTVINNRLNNVMKYLASITIVMAIPTIISGLYGMNVSSKGMPLSGSVYGFGIICLLTLMVCIVTIFILRKRNML